MPSFGESRIGKFAHDCVLPFLLFPRAWGLKCHTRIEQTEALLAVGVIGRDRKEVGLLVQTAFKKYNAAKHCEESNLPENYVPPPEPAQVGRPVPQGS